MAEGGRAGKKPEPSLLDKAKGVVKKVSDTLNPVKQFGPGAQETMRDKNRQYNAARGAAIDREVEGRRKR